MREKILWNQDWRFHLGDDDKKVPQKKMVMYMGAKTERMVYGFASEDYREDSINCPEAWNEVTLPHDYIISQQPRQENNESTGYFRYDNAWYKKRFLLEEKDQRKRITLYFEGIATYSEIYVNGCLMERNFSGYNSFEVDITDMVRFDRENTVSVYVNAEHHEGWWYTGAGIYRNVWLVKTEKTAVDLWGVYINPQPEKQGAWKVSVQTTVRNDMDLDREVQVENIVFYQNREIVRTKSAQKIGFRAKALAKQELSVQSPKLWDIEEPNLYRMVTNILLNGAAVDSVETSFGFRTFAFSNQGFTLNGKNRKLHGVCCHEDFGITGKVVPDTVKRLRLQMLKEMGVNAYRTAHYPHSEETMTQLDQLGILVMDETRWFMSTPEGMKYYEMLLKRDRNHPSVVLWSIGNEEPLHIMPQGTRIAKSMLAKTRQLDPTRPVTTAVDKNPAEACVMDTVDVMGVNYNLKAIDPLHQRLPEKAMVLSECTASCTSRGWYDDADRMLGFWLGYDNKSSDFGESITENWRFIYERPWLAGGFQWTGLEYRGESGWPLICSQSGAIDLFLQKKDSFYLNQAIFTKEPMVHLLPHWNFQGREGDLIEVWAYTNCDQVHLELNGKDLGIQQIERFGHGAWSVPYERGTLSVTGYRNGEKAAEDRAVTSGPAKKLMLGLENQEPLRANGRDVAVVTCYCLDENGITVPDASPFLRFSGKGEGSILGTGSDDRDHQPPHCRERKMYMGLCTVAVKAGAKAGSYRLYVSADGLEQAMLEIKFE